MCPGAERESREHEESLAAENTGELQPAKVPLHPIDIVNSKKVIAVRKEQKRKLSRQRSYSATVDYSPLAIDKHEPEFVSEEFQTERCFISLTPAGHRWDFWVNSVSLQIFYLFFYFLKGPCRRKLDGIIQGMKDTSRVMALSLYLPNCDRKGFFKRKQVPPDFHLLHFKH